MPFAIIKLTTAENVQGRACSDCDVGDDQAWVMCWESIMDRIGKDTDFVIEEEKDTEDDEY
jgi:hypothetical protein